MSGTSPRELTDERIEPYPLNVCAQQPIVPSGPLDKICRVAQQRRCLPCELRVSGSVVAAGDSTSRGRSLCAGANCAYLDLDLDRVAQKALA
jgi:hypothetical protein